MTVIVYGLIDDRNPVEVRYVGVAVNPEYRLRRHLKDGDDKRRTHKRNWIRSVQRDGGVVSWMTLATADTYAEAFSLERALIRQYRSLGARLLNSTDGGEGVVGYRFTDERRKQISEWAKSRKGKIYRSEAARANIAAAMRAYWATHSRPDSAETRRKKSESHRGKKLSDEHIERLRQASTDRRMPELLKAKLIAIHRDAVVTAETRAKIGDAFRGKRQSQDHVNKRTDKIRGRKRTEEQRARIRAAVARTIAARRAAGLRAWGAPGRHK
jgi:hypothetical protein